MQIIQTPLPELTWIISVNRQLKWRPFLHGLLFVSALICKASSICWDRHLPGTRQQYSKRLFYSFTTQSRLLTTQRKTPFENIVGKGENADKKYVLLFPWCFLPPPPKKKKKNVLTHYHTILHFEALLIYSSGNHVHRLSDTFCQTRGAWAPVSLHRPDFSVTMKGRF